MSTAIRLKDDIIILEPAGKIIGEAIPELREVLITQIDKSKRPRILINLKRVHKMDSAGLGTFIVVYNMVRAKGGRIAIINVGKHIKNLIVQSRLINIFEHFNTEDAAIKAFSNTYLKNY
ncbi:MAG: STAS domain-containing protein [Candidatus Poribacteria bacterium]|nr:STAS domain-containing protein [Candidatus Poribacteria bacterium]